MQEPLPNSAIEKVINDSGLVEALCDESIDTTGNPRQTSTLIEFPGKARALPEWRKQLSQRVREVQERRAREAAEEAAAAQEAGIVSCSLPSAQLELVPDLEHPVMNPIVSKALERLERARRPEAVSGGYAAATAPALEPCADEVSEPEPERAEPKTRLTVVASQKIEVVPEVEIVAATDHEVLELEVSPLGELLETEDQLLLKMNDSPIDSPAKLVSDLPKLELTAPPETISELPPVQRAADRKPVRLISDSVDDVALSYLETCLSLPVVTVQSEYVMAGFGRRLMAGILDLLVVALMAAPVAAAIEFSDGDWSDLRVIGLMSGLTMAAMFSYLTVSIALTGRTLAMRIFSLRTIDLRTGLIPTGSQAMKRALAYIFALAVLGLGILYALVDPDRRTIYDRFSKTIVIRD